ncbi:Nitrogenase FeMo-cofactor scaffold and assembly protein NifE [Caenispirillum salinarum AK4]|uniref:Nitrogenase iron-molybdenum cofactor biosynthesis protein NifE n=1 Tax=Caenispirillum salinarum AK4 TaxID=1238182 RepID=K9HK58_9PROT|nr:nitrogenase iron-molybdenum cofactor biosynthesis protein NifE [Caenispirillum salinarum]EKV30728.1 Nitrogenase FeMo-cofactor scaffold and assembly protein NifE [Caenispirillum salinarum AK4]
MLKQKVQELFNEPGCVTNQGKSDAERKKGCSIKGLTPGAAAGGCAYDGALIALQPITDVVHLVHGPIACAGNAWDNRHAASSGSELYRMGFTTDMSELDVIHGGEKKLWKAIKDVIADRNPPAVFVYQTCVPALIGDDVEKVCEVATEKLGVPVIPVNAPGFVGSKNLGNKLGGEALLDHVIGTMEPDDAGPTDVNIIGEYNLSGELWQVKPLFEKLGIRLRACITGDARYRDVATAHRARVNMMVCSQAMINVGRKMQERWGIPFFEGSFYGIEDTSDVLRTMSRLLVDQGADPGLIDRAEALIAEEEENAWAAIRAYKPRLEGRKVLLYTGGHKSWSVVSALQEVGMEVVRTSVRKATDNDKARALDLMEGEESALVGAIPAPEMYRMLEEGEADIMLSGGRTQFVALKARRPWLDINQERHYAYAGYVGMVELVRQLDKAVNNPMWATIQKDAPWDADGNLLTTAGGEG